MANEKTLKSGHSIWWEFETRSIDQYGDAIDVNHWDTLEQAKAEHLKDHDVESGAVAWVLEKHTQTDKRGVPDKYRILARRGSREALEAGGWLEDSDRE